MATSANCRLVARLPRTAFRPGVSGNPRGKQPGTRNRVTVEAREIATRLIQDPAYLTRLRERLLAGTAGQIEPVLWAYAFGKPLVRIETGAEGRFAKLTDVELKRRLLAAIAALP